VSNALIALNDAMQAVPHAVSQASLKAVQQAVPVDRALQIDLNPGMVCAAAVSHSGSVADRLSDARSAGIHPVSVTAVLTVLTVQEEQSAAYNRILCIPLLRNVFLHIVRFL
jgi:hypothetical protein